MEWKETKILPTKEETLRAVIVALIDNGKDPRLSTDEVGKMAAKIVNDAYDGLNAHDETKE